jgi:thiamine-phosphate pyrophosphorylase
MICLVTDRRRLAGEDAPLAIARRCLVAQAEYAVAAGIDLIQLREHDLDAADLAALTRDLVAVTRGTATRVVVNDRLDVALACGADGVHLRAASVAVEPARRITPAGFLIGRSVHRVDEAADAAGADYLIAGTVFSSRSKPASHALLGLDGLGEIARSVEIPVVAIGGVDRGQFDAIAQSGAAGFAAIGLFMAVEVGPHTSRPPACRAVPLAEIVADARSRFDRVQRAS